MEDVPRWSGSTSSIGSHNTDRDSPGTPTPNARRVRDNYKLARSKAAIRGLVFSDLPDDTPQSPQKAQSTSSTGGAESSDEESSITSDDLEDPTNSNHIEPPITKVYDQYDLSGFSPEDFDLLLTMAPADQLPELNTSEVKTEELPNDNITVIESVEQNEESISREGEAVPDLPTKRPATHMAIKRYVIFHKFNQDPYASHTISQRREFERNVYDYARANGLSKQEARSEIREARVMCGAPESDSEDSSYGPEDDDSSEILAQLATTTFSFQDLQKEGVEAVGDGGELTSPRAIRARKKSKRGRKMGEEQQNTAETQGPVADATRSENAASGNANVESNTSQATEVPTLTSSVPANDGRRSRRKRKRVDVEAADDPDPTNQSLPAAKKSKKSKHFEQRDEEQTTTVKSQPSSASNPGTMEVDAVHEKHADKVQTSPTMPKDSEKATKRQEKRNRRREKRAAESKELPDSETKKPGEGQVPTVDVAQSPSTKVVTTKPSNSKSLPPAKKEKSNKKSKRHESKSKVGDHVSSSSHEDPATSKELGPNDPKSELEAHQNFLRANMHDPHETTVPAGKTTSLAEAEGKQSNFIAKLDALKRYSNEKQVQLYDDGKYANADKQTKADLKNLKEEKTTMQEMDVDTPMTDEGLEKRKERKSRKSKTKKDKTSKDKTPKADESGGEDRVEARETKESSTRPRKTKSGAGKQMVLSPTEQVDFH